MENTEKPASADSPITQARDAWWIRFIRYVKRKIEERAAKKQKETPADKAARIAANATVWIAIFTVVSVGVSVFTYLILKGQLKEMHDGGVDTHTLAEAAQNANSLSRAFFSTFVVTPQSQLGRIAIDLGNSGRVIAIISSVTAALTIQRLSDNSIVQQEQREWKGPILVQSGFGKWFDIKGEWPVNPNKREDAIWRELWKNTITVRVELSYSTPVSFLLSLSSEKITPIRVSIVFSA